MSQHLKVVELDNYPYKVECNPHGVKSSGNKTIRRETIHE